MNDDEMEIDKERVVKEQDLENYTDMTREFENIDDIPNENEVRKEQGVEEQEFVKENIDDTPNENEVRKEQGEEEQDLENYDDIIQEFDENIVNIPYLYESAKAKRAWQTCCVQGCKETNLTRTMFHFPKVTFLKKGVEILNEDKLQRYVPKLILTVALHVFD
jgi:hypothetical protein